MTAPTIAPETLVDYLADRLPDRERAEFERAAAARPEVVHELEQTLRLREGLAVLREQGRLPLRRRAPSTWRRSGAWAIAATVAAVAIAVVLTVRTSPPDVPRLGTRAPAPGVVAGTLTLVSTRGNAEPVVMVAPPPGQLLEIRALAGSASGTTHYTLTLERFGADGTTASVGVARDLAPDAASMLVVYVPAESLPPGRYALRVDSRVAGAVGEHDLFGFDVIAAGSVTAAR
ncbi:MAG: hypothetical protein JSR73_07610 [Proteobacteria bacterium]|nr:hypothetical protein [Pseudomonadota bacterium]